MTGFQDPRRTDSRLTGAQGGRCAERHTIPKRYSEPPAQVFGEAVARHIAEGGAILDVGSGRQPALAPEQRPALTRYVGLDVSRAELQAAPAGSYDEAFVSDVTMRLDQLRGRFDTVVSWQVLEHVTDVATALENMRSYLRPAGHLIAMLSGRFSVQGILSKVVPEAIGVRLMRELLGRDPDSVFPVHYDRCHHRALTRLLRPWSSADVAPLYQGGSYFNFSASLRRLYFVYEDWAYRSGHANLATHYLLVARR